MWIFFGNLLYIILMCTYVFILNTYFEAKPQQQTPTNDIGKGIGGTVAPPPPTIQLGGDIFCPPPTFGNGTKLQLQSLCKCLQVAHMYHCVCYHFSYTLF